MKLLFIHRSVGQQIIDCVRTNQSFSELELYDFNANNNNLTDSMRSITKCSPLSVLSGDTSPSGLARFFQKASTEGPISECLIEFDIIAFKSCYSANNIHSKDQLASYKKAYRGSIAAYIANHPKKIFIITSPPPRRSLFTNKKSRLFAKEYSIWLSTFANTKPNCAYLNLFDALSEKEVLARKLCRYLPWDQHPNRRGAETATDCFIQTLKELQ
jgi:hypothetical protein